MVNSEWSIVNNKRFIQSVLLCGVVIVFSCHSSSQKDSSSQRDFSKIKIGMTFVDVMKLAGAPDTIIHLGIVVDTFNNQTKTDEWHYGENQIVVIVNDTVNAVDLHANETRQHIQHIMDSARAAEGNSNPFIQPAQQ